MESMTKKQVEDYLYEHINETLYDVPFTPRSGWYYISLKFDGECVDFLFWDGVDCIGYKVPIDRFLDSEVYYKTNKWDFSS